MKSSTSNLKAFENLENLIKTAEILEKVHKVQAAISQAAAAPAPAAPAPVEPIAAPMAITTPIVITAPARVRSRSLGTKDFVRQANFRSPSLELKSQKTI